MRASMLTQMLMVQGEIRMIMLNNRRITGRPKVQDRRQTK